MSTPSTVATPAALIHDPLWSWPQPGMTSERIITQRGSSNSECLRAAGLRRALLVSAVAGLSVGEITPDGPISTTPPSGGGAVSVAAEMNGGAERPGSAGAGAAEAIDRSGRASARATRLAATILRRSGREAGGNAWESNPP